jgi:hypothetical protein
MDLYYIHTVLFIIHLLRLGEVMWGQTGQTVFLLLIGQNWNWTLITFNTQCSLPVHPRVYETHAAGRPRGM